MHHRRTSFLPAGLRSATITYAAAKTGVHGPFDIALPVHPGYIIGFIKLPILIIISFIENINSIKVKGTLTGFEEKMTTLSRFSFTTQNGRFIEKTDFSCAVENLLMDADVERMLRKKYHKSIPIMSLKSEPENIL